MDFLTASKLGFSIKEVAKKMQVEIKPIESIQDYQLQFKKGNNKPNLLLPFLINQIIF